MSAPILMALTATPADSVLALGGVAKGAPVDDGAGSFELTLGAMIAAAFAPAPASAPPPPAEPLIELVLDGEWMPDEATEETGSQAEGSATSATPTGDTAGVPNEPALITWYGPPHRQMPARAVISTEPTATPDQEEPIVPLEKSLHEWMSTFGQAAEPETKAIDRAPRDETGDDRSEETTEFPERLEVVVSPIPIEPVATVDTPVVFVNPIAAPPLPTVSTPIRPEAPVVRDPRFAHERAEVLGALSIDQGLDADTLLAMRSMHESGVEIGGFGFPTAKEASSAPAPVAPDSLIPPEEWNVVATSQPDARKAAERLTTRVAAQSVERLLAGQPRESDPLTAPGKTWTPVLSTEQSSETSPDRAGRVLARAVETGAVEPDRAVTRKKETADYRGGEHRPDTNAAPRLTDFTVENGDAPAASTALDQGTERIARRVDSLMLDLKDDQGDYGRLKVSVSGPLVRATILPNDQGMADRLNIEIRQLRQTLEERGFAEPKITVQSPKSDSTTGGPTLGRDVVTTTAGNAEHQAPRREGSEDDRRQRWSEPREERREQGRSSNRSRDQRQQQRRERE